MKIERRPKKYNYEKITTITFEENDAMHKLQVLPHKQFARKMVSTVQS